jgi:hypothetical protein
MLLRRVRPFWILVSVAGIAVAGWLRWIALYVGPREQALAFRWAEDRWLPSLFALARLGGNENILSAIAGLCALILVLNVGLYSARRSHAFSWFLRPLGLLIPAAAFSPWMMSLMMTSRSGRWWFAALALGVLALLLNPVPSPPVRRRVTALAPLILALGTVNLVLLVAVRNLNSLHYFYSFQVVTNALAIIVAAVFGAVFLVLAVSRSESRDPHFAPSLVSLVLLPIALVTVTNLAPPVFLVRSDRVPRLTPEAADYLQYLWAGKIASGGPVSFEYSYRVPELEEVYRRVKVPQNASALGFDASFHEAMGDLLRLPLHTRVVREWVFPWLRYRVRHPCEPMLSTYERLIAHDPFVDPEEVAVYREAMKACEVATPDRAYNAIILLLAHGFVEEARDEARSMLSKSEKANRYLPRDRGMDVDALRRRIDEAERYFGEDSRKTGGIVGSVLVEEGALKPGIGVAASVKIGVSLYYPSALPFPPASAFTGYADPDANGAFRILDLPIRDYAVIVALRRDSFRDDVSVEVSRPLVRLTSENYSVRDFVVRIKAGGDFFGSIERTHSPPATLSREAVKEITGR